MRTLRFHLPVLDADDVELYLDLATDIDGVVAALIDEDRAWLDVIVSSSACALLVKEEIVAALTGTTRAVTA